MLKLLGTVAPFFNVTGEDWFSIRCFLLGARLANTQSNPFYQPFNPNATHVRLCTRLSLLFILRVEVVIALIHNLEWSPLLLPCVQRGVTSQCVSINFGQLVGLESSHLGIVFTKGFHKLSLRSIMRGPTVIMSAVYSK